MKVLELFSGTGSVGKVCKKFNMEVVSLDLILEADIKEDIFKWNYKIYEPGHFDIITASPVCLWWSQCRLTNIGRKLKAHDGKTFTKKMFFEDIEKFGKPMVDKVFEIINYFKPRYWWIENPQTGYMKTYIKDKPFYDVDYCKYADWGYKKRTRFWTNIEGFKPLLCKKDCNSIEGGKHKVRIGGFKSTTKKDRYRIPPLLIGELLKCIIYNEVEKQMEELKI